MARHLCVLLLAGLLATPVVAQWQPTSAQDADPITHSGNVAIGTSTPQTNAVYPLMVFGGGGTKAIRVQTTTDHAAFVETSANGACNTRLQSNSSTGWAGTVTAHPFLLVVNASERARIDTAGYFGLGTTAPISSMHQYSNTASNPVTAAISGAGWDGLLTLNASSLGATGGGGGVVFGGGGASQYFAAIKSLLSNGSSNTTGDLAFATRSSVFDFGLTERMRVTAAGAVGIGTASPTAASALTVGSAFDARLDVVSQTAGAAVVRIISNNSTFGTIDSMDASYATPKHLLPRPK